MKITLPKLQKFTEPTDLLILPTFKLKLKESDKKAKVKAAFEIEKTLKELNHTLSGHLVKEAAEEGFSGDEGQCYATSTLAQAQAKAVALIGMGHGHEQTLDLFRRAGGEAFKLGQKKRAKKLSLVVPEKTTLPLFDVAQALAEGMRLASYRFDRYLTKDKKEHFVKEIDIFLPKDPSAEQKDALTRADDISAGVLLACDLINEGPWALNPKKFAEHATAVAEKTGLAIDILDEKQLRKEHMNLMLAVASAAELTAPPRLIRLAYKPKNKSKRTIALIGKGVTFDSGGLDIKTADGMLDMKVDMSGAAAVLGAMQAIAHLAPKVNVVGYMVCVENGIGPSAYHPGDVITSRKGITVEISNTDAEGRLILADAIHYAVEVDNPDTIIDVATLTGACMIALGVKTAGVFANDDALSDAICRSGHTAGELFWRLPITPQQKETLRSSVADIKNSGERYGGAISGAIFIQEFVPENVRWAHLDIAGPATNLKPHSYLPIGGVGFSVRTLVDYVMGQ